MNDDFGIAGKTALVTGSGRNIGRAIALELAAGGANVVVNTRSNEAEAEAVAKEADSLGARSLVVMGDAAEKDTVDRMRTEAEKAFGGVDIYVSNAARRPGQGLLRDHRRGLARRPGLQQLDASWYLAKAFVPGMRDRGWGRVVHITGAGGFIGQWNRIPPTRSARAACTPSRNAWPRGWASMAPPLMRCLPASSAPSGTPRPNQG